MQIVLLGTAAGGGSPQWNCNCTVCAAVRKKKPGTQPRTESSVAISADGHNWFLLNASPDIRTQFAHFPPLHPPRGVKRGSKVQGVLVTNADLDHTLGLLLLREGGEKIPVHASSAVREVLENDSAIGRVLKSFCGVKWIKPPRRLAPLLRADGSPSGLLYQAIDLKGGPPRFSPPQRSEHTGHSVGYRIIDERTGGRLLFLPDVAATHSGLGERLSECDVLLFDGTFWSENEMSARGVGQLAAARMGHWPISGPQGSLSLLARLSVRHKVYIHINNTNPILRETTPEHRAVNRAGLTVGRDGMRFEI